MDSDTVKLVKPHKEAMVADLDAGPGMLEPCVLPSAKERSPVRDQESRSNRDSRDSRSLMTLVHSVSMFMFSMLQSGWRLCRWKVCTLPSLTLTPSPPLSLLQHWVFGLGLVLFCLRQSLV